MLAPYQKVQETLRKQILTGQLEEGDLLPSEHVLGERFGITRMTVRKALDGLVREGYIEKRQGKGSVVSTRRKTLRLLSFRGFSDALKDQEKTVQTEMIQSPQPTDWPASFFYSLSQQERKHGCISLVRLRSIESAPVMLEYTFLPNIKLDRLCEQPFVAGSLFKTLNAVYHIDVTSVQQDVRAIGSDQNTAHYLGLKPSEPVLHIYRRYGTNKQGFFLYSSLYCNTQNYMIGSYFESV